jgi:epoxyqueuosine reductase
MEFQPRQITAQAFGQDEGDAREDSLVAPELNCLVSLTQEEFSAIFRKSAVKRAKWRGLVRNACVALGNSSLTRDSDEYSRVVQLLKELAAREDAVVAEHAKWALARLAAPDAKMVPVRDA